MENPSSNTKFDFYFSNIPSASDIRKTTDEENIRRNEEAIEDNELNLKRLVCTLVDLIDDYSYNGRYFFNIYFNFVNNQLCAYSYNGSPSWGINLGFNRLKNDFKNSFKCITPSCIFQKENLEMIESMFTKKGYKFTFDEFEENTLIKKGYHIYISWEKS